MGARSRAFEPEGNLKTIQPTTHLVKQVKSPTAFVEVESNGLELVVLIRDDVAEFEVEARLNVSGATLNADADGVATLGESSTGDRAVPTIETATSEFRNGLSGASGSGLMAQSCNRVGVPRLTQLVRPCRSTSE